MGALSDTDAYREKRALETFNLGNLVGIDCNDLKPTLMSWVFHILCFIVPRQIILLGDPSRRSCDACESLGAWYKRTIKHRTCRRRLHEPNARGIRPTISHEKKAGKKTKWTQTFTKGFIQVAFERAVVSESLLHGEDNAAYQLRRFAFLKQNGKLTSHTHRKFESEPVHITPRKISDILAEENL